MSYGFYFNCDGVVFDTSSVAWVLIDVIQSSATGSGSKTYSDAPDDLTFDYAIVPVEADAVVGSPTGSGWRDGGLNVSVNQGAKQVSWNWSDPSGNGYRYTEAMIAVFGR